MMNIAGIAKQAWECFMQYLIIKLHTLKHSSNVLNLKTQHIKN